jgi:hypothetical protein
MLNTVRNKTFKTTSIHFTSCTLEPDLCESDEATIKAYFASFYFEVFFITQEIYYNKYGEAPVRSKIESQYIQ